MVEEIDEKSDIMKKEYKEKDFVIIMDLEILAIR